MTRFSKFLFALLLGLSIATATGCPDNNNNGGDDLSIQPDAAVDLSKKD